MNSTRKLPKTAALLAAITLTVTALAAPLPTYARLQLHDDQGSLVGYGELEGKELELDVLAGQAGTATLTVSSFDGTVTIYDVRYSDTGEILLVVDGAVVSLADFAVSEGLRLDLDVENVLDEPWDDDSYDDRDRHDDEDDDRDDRHDDDHDHDDDDDEDDRDDD
ncbi:MAG: hypothetical protein KF875_07300 [Trueperaceae bacterium]|nr:hypothetical protein [Trueperaceae bacterium]MCO5173581.1 hypothetical protein [Trueperaceae bacterium]MCW5818569.1 hypothetical protein [Trueperaceae bacterium]